MEWGRVVGNEQTDGRPWGGGRGTEYLRAFGVTW